MIDREQLSLLTCQVEVCSSRAAALYYTPKPVSAGDLELMREIDQASPRVPVHWRPDAARFASTADNVGRRHVAPLMRLMGIEALYRKKRAPGAILHIRYTPTFSATSRSSGRTTCGALI